jgi:hypothetical protein
MSKPILQKKQKKSKPEKNRKNQENNRDEKGRFIKGESGNPDGRPEGSGDGFSITRLVREELQKCPEGEDKKTYADLVIKRIMSKAIKDGDTKMIDRIWAYMDGMPKQPLDIFDPAKEEMVKSLEKIVKSFRK